MRTLAALFIGALPLWFGGRGLQAYFTPDDMMNLYGYWSKPLSEVVAANFLYYSPSYRPLGALFYLPLFEVFGFNPAPFRIASFALMLLNLGLMYKAVEALTGTREIALLAALLGAYHAEFEDLYYNSGTIYDLLCFLFYFGALYLYVQRRRSERPIGWRMGLLIVTLYICALNAKEMAATLPVAILAYELLVRGNVRESWFAGLLGALTVPYVAGKLSTQSVLSQVGDYKLDVSLGRYLHTYAYYLDKLFYRDPGFFDLSVTILLAVAMASAAALFRCRTMWFAFAFTLFSALPALFITPRGTIFVLYVPFFGWCLYGAAFAVRLREACGWNARWAAPATFLLLGAVLVSAHVESTRRPSLDSAIKLTVEQAPAFLPTVAPGARILLLQDPFPVEEWTPVFVFRLLYRDPSIQVDRIKKMDHRPDGKGIAAYDIVLSYAEGRYSRQPERVMKSGRSSYGQESVSATLRYASALRPVRETSVPSGPAHRQERPISRRFPEPDRRGGRVSRLERQS